MGGKCHLPVYPIRNRGRNSIKLSHLVFQQIMTLRNPIISFSGREKLHTPNQGKSRGSGHAKYLILKLKWHKNLSETVLIHRFSSKTALLRESTKNKFDYKHDLIPLVSDEDHRMAEAYGVWIEKKILKSSTVF